MGLNLFTLAEYKVYAGIVSTTQDVQINTLIPKVSQLAKTICARAFNDYVDDAKVEVYAGGTTKLVMSEYPLIALSSVEYSDDYGATYTPLIEFIDFVVDSEDGHITSVAPTGFPKKINGYKVTYTAGFDPIPEDLKVAVMDLLSYYLKNDMAVKSQRNVGANTVQIEYITKNTLPSHISRVFDLYKSTVN
jgi:hypothetical protein